MKKFSTIAILALMFVGCNNNLENVEPTIEGTPMTIMATTADEATEGRTALNTADGKTVVWKTGDKIGVFCEYNGNAVGTGYQNEFTLASGNDTTSGEFSGSIAGLDAVETNVEGQFLRYHAYYPMTAANASKKKFALVGTLNAIQSYDVTAEYNDMSNDDVMIGKYLNGSKEETTIPLTFEHVFAMMNFEISSAEALTVNKVDMIAPEGILLSGAYTLQANKALAADTNPKFNSGSTSVGVNVKNGQIAAGGKIIARLIFNRWAATAGQTLTVKVYTDKGVQTFNKTATDFSGKNNWGLRLALDTSKMEAAIVDNYDSATMTLWDSTTSLPKHITAAGTYCIAGEVAYAATCQLRVKTEGANIAFVGRTTENGVPQDIFTAVLVQSQNTNSGQVNLLVKDLNLKSYDSSMPFIRFNNSYCTLNSITIENCVIDCLEKAPIMICGANHGTLNVVIRNCVFKNCGATIINGSGAGGSENLSFTFENNTIHSTTAESVESLLNLTGCTNDGFTTTIQNNTIIAIEAATLSLQWATEEI